MKKGLYTLLIIILLPINIFSKGVTEESDYNVASGKENWEHEVEIQDKKPGKYNLLIRAKDKAENEAFSGPFDIYVDPESDLPLISITNPASLMRVGGALNIVGTARDDDAVGKVYLKINDGEYFEAKGTEFWSYTLDANVLEDGQHTITAKSVDINGVEGHEVSVTYNQDTVKPVITIENYSNGAVFTGKSNINGKVVDANGIDRLEVSRDDQQTYSEIKFSKNKNEDFYTFELGIDTEKLTDGPIIYWFKSKDKTGSVGVTPFLFFVDNVGPAATIIDPVVDEKLNGNVTISGSITDTIGIKSFKYIYNGKEGEIPLLAGNPYWSQTFNFLNEGGKEAKVIFISEDMSGNIAQFEYKVPLDKLVDKPRLTLTSPKVEGQYKNTLILEGYIEDDDYVKGIEYTIDGKEYPLLETFNSFSHKVEGLESGSHRLTVTPVDSDGVKGDSTDVSFFIESYEPQIMINSIVKNGEESLFYPGIEVTTDGKYQILGSVSTGNKLAKLSYSINNGDYKDIKWSAGSARSISLFSIDVDNTFNYGALNFSVKATDNYGNEIIKDSLVYVKNYTVINDDWGLYNVLPPEDEYIKVTQNNPFEAYFNGPEIKGVSVSPNTNVVKVSFEGKVIKVYPNAIGQTDNVKIIANTDKGLFETKEFKFISDNVKPDVSISSLTITGNNILLEGVVKEFILDRLQYRLSTDNDYSNLNFTGDSDSYSFSKSISFDSKSAETVSVEVRATDKLGNIFTVRKSLIIESSRPAQLVEGEAESNTGKGSDKPKLFVNFPASNQLVYSNPSLSGYARDDDSVKEIKISDVNNPDKVETYKVENIFDIPLSDFGGGRKNLSVIAIDINGVESVPVKVSYTNIIDDSVLSIDKFKDSDGTSNYLLGSLIGKEKGVTLEGTIKGFSEGSVTYSFGDSFIKAAKNGDKFTINIPESLNWGQNHLIVIFKDVYGRQSYYKTFFYITDKNSNKDIIDDPGIYLNDKRLSEEFVIISKNTPLEGYFVGRAIKNVYLEAKSGRVPGFISVSNSDNRVIISPSNSGLSGDLRVVLTTEDNDVYRSQYFKFVSDDVKPELEVTTNNNLFIKNTLLLTGSVSDNIKVSALNYSTDGGSSWEDVEIYRNKNSGQLYFSKEIHFVEKLDGGYSVILKADDLSGNSAIETLSFVKDVTAPEVSLFTPGTDEVNGTVSISGKAFDNIELDNISYSFNGRDFTEVGKKGVFSFLLNFGEFKVFPKTFVIRATDKSGNITDIYPEFNINQEKDKPVVQIQTPIEGEVIRNDFIISGMAFDDDGIDTIYYSLDGGEMVEVAKEANNFSLNIPLESVSNNDHLITVKAVDILGVESDIVTSTFWVSKEEPVSELLLPKIEETKRDTIVISGKSFDENGIDSVYISTDNGVSYQKAIGQENWNYTFNTKNINDGTYSIFIKAIDKLETPGFYATLINIDNTPPELIINEPYDGDILSDKITFSGRSLDNIGLKEVKYKVYSHIPGSARKVIVDEGNLSNGGIFNIDIPLNSFKNGEYNIELIAFDLAENRSIATRNFTVASNENAGDLELFFPQAGSVYTSHFEVAGQVIGKKKVKEVECYIDSTLTNTIEVNEFNYFNLNVDTLVLTDGEHNLKLRAKLPGGQVYETDNTVFFIDNSGGWVQITNMNTGDNISGRPFLKGTAGFIQSPETPKKELIKPELIEVSLDNGQRFEEASGKSEWEYRLETWQFNDGLIPVLVRATFSNGDIKTTRMAVNIDRTRPEVDILQDLEDGRFNGSIPISGTASDSNGLTDVSVVLRDGDKSRYEIPGLFQGMFVDTEVSLNKIIGGGIGLTFFDDNVKLQFTAGQTREGSENARIKGTYYGGKLLANLYTFEFGNFLGPDWDFFSMSLGVGASFTEKTIIISEVEGDVEKRMWFSSIISQLEFAKFKFGDGLISSVSLYSEFEMTLLSAEQDGGFKPHIGVGTRLTFF